MAGGHHVETIHTDPAVVKYNANFMERYKHFRWTPRTTFLTVVYCVAFPAFIGFLGYKYEGKWEFRGKRRNDIISEM